MTALVSPNRKGLADLAVTLHKTSLSFEQLCSDPDVIAHVMGSFAKIGRQLGYAKKELPVAITLVPEEWTQENDLLTAALKMRRKQVNQFYSKQIEDMFARTKEIE